MHQPKALSVIRTCIWLAVLSMLFPPFLVAQDSSKYYTVMHPEEFEQDWKSFYTRMTELTAQARAELPHHLDLAYGSDPKQKLDIYLPKEKAAGAAPVFLFLHGGGMREGDRAHYGAVAPPFARHGVITAVASYRLTPDGFHFPDQPNDIKAAIKWLYDNVAKYGGDPNSIYVGGHSAGGRLTAMVGVDRAWLTEQGLPTDVLKGIVPVGASYDLRTAPPAESAPFAPTPELVYQASPIAHIGDPAPKAIVAAGTLETVEQISKDLAKALAAAGSDASFLLLEGRAHQETAYAFIEEDSELFQAILDMMGR